MPGVTIIGKMVQNGKSLGQRWKNGLPLPDIKRGGAISKVDVITDVKTSCLDIAWRRIPGTILQTTGGVPGICLVLLME